MYPDLILSYVPTLLPLTSLYPTLNSSFNDIWHVTFRNFIIKIGYIYDKNPRFTIGHQRRPSDTMQP